MQGFILDFHQGGSNVTIAELWEGGSKDYIDTSNAFSLSRNIIELIKFLKLGGSGACSPRKIFNFSICETVSGGF